MQWIPKIALYTGLLCFFCMVSFLNVAPVLAQKADTSHISIKPRPKIVSRVPVIKGSVQTYKPAISFNNNNNNTSSVPVFNAAPSQQSARILTVLKLYPNPVSTRLNINLKLEREVVLSIKITDLLSNEIITLMNEKTPAGEQTKTFDIPKKLNPGIYFVRIIAGGDPKVLKISVL